MQLPWSKLKEIEWYEDRVERRGYHDFPVDVIVIHWKRWWKFPKKFRFPRILKGGEFRKTGQYREFKSQLQETINGNGQDIPKREAH